jgi:hypothetical protein
LTRFLPPALSATPKLRGSKKNLGCARIVVLDDTFVATVGTSGGNTGVRSVRDY